MAINGTNNSDVINDTIFGDEIFGRGGNDIIRIGIGDDVVNAGGGADTIFDNDFNLFGLTFGSDDIINGDSGDDVIFAGKGRDTYNGGSGVDTVNYSRSILGLR